MSLKRIMVIRHGEKPSVDGTVLGVTLEGISNSDELSVRGWQRAGAFVRFFAPADGQERAGIGRPESLFAQRQTEHVTSVRAPHTLGPLADFIGKPISTQFAKGEEELLAAALSAEAATVLVAWEHKAICLLANFIMGDNQHTPQFWADDRFDIVWVFESNGARWSFNQVPQLLLPGDRSDPV